VQSLLTLPEQFSSRAVTAVKRASTVLKNRLVGAHLRRAPEVGNQKSERPNCQQPQSKQQETTALARERIRVLAAPLANRIMRLVQLTVRAVVGRSGNEA
jgi:hypothetical protein